MLLVQDNFRNYHIDIAISKLTPSIFSESEGYNYSSEIQLIPNPNNKKAIID